MVSLASMATPADGNVTAVAKNEVFGIIILLLYIMKRVRAGMLSSKKKTSPGKNLLKASNIKTLKALK